MKIYNEAGESTRIAGVKEIHIRKPEYDEEIFRIKNEATNNETSDK